MTFCLQRSRYSSNKFDAVFDPVGGDPVCSASVSRCCFCCHWLGGDADTNCFVPKAARLPAGYTNRSRAVVRGTFHLPLISTYKTEKSLWHR